jgi:hypothetical protein
MQKELSFCIAEVLKKDAEKMSPEMESHLVSRLQ